MNRLEIVAAFQAASKAFAMFAEVVNDMPPELMEAVRRIDRESTTVREWIDSKPPSVLSVRAYNVLMQLDKALTMDKLVVYVKNKQMLRLRNVGMKTYKEVRDLLTEDGYI